MKSFEAGCMKRGRCQGQALLEMVIVVFLLITICSGMLAGYRALQFNWFAQEEARFLAFAKVLGSSDPAGDLAAQKIQRPRYVERATASRKVDSSGGLADLIGKTSPSGLPGRAVNYKTTGSGAPRQFAGISRSGFWKLVDKAGAGAPGRMAAEQVLLSSVPNDPAFRSMQRLNTYVGSREALQVLNTTFDLAVREYYGGLSPDDYFKFESSLNQALHNQPKSQGIPYTGISIAAFKLRYNYILRDEWVAELFEGVMDNVYSTERDRISSDIDNSLISAQVSYSGLEHAYSGLPVKIALPDSAAASFVLLGSSWDIPRRSASGWREMGGESDGMNADTDEAMLRRRVMGLWIFPTDPFALIKPVRKLFPGQTTEIFDLLQGVIRITMTELKKFFASDPLGTLLKPIHYIPGMKGLDLQFQIRPAVRPDAYPGSQEMTNDKLTGSARRFSDYVDEQRNFWGADE